MLTNSWVNFVCGHFSTVGQWTKSVHKLYFHSTASQHKNALFTPYNQNRTLVVTKYVKKVRRTRLGELGGFFIHFFHSNTKSRVLKIFQKFKKHIILTPFYFNIFCSKIFCEFFFLLIFSIVIMYRFFRFSICKGKF
jgi:hypothetical protein